MASAIWTDETRGQQS